MTKFLSSVCDIIRSSNIEKNSTSAWFFCENLKNFKKWHNVYKMNNLEKYQKIK